jgi:hypothetical protein
MSQCRTAKGRIKKGCHLTKSGRLVKKSSKRKSSSRRR